jgi:hypothetical protein
MCVSDFLSTIEGSPALPSLSRPAATPSQYRVGVSDWDRHPQQQPFCGGNRVAESLGI